MIEIWGKDSCPHCSQAKDLAKAKGLTYEYKLIDKDFTREELFENFPGARTFPQIKVDGQAIGGFKEFAALV